MKQPGNSKRFIILSSEDTQTHARRERKIKTSIIKQRLEDNIDWHFHLEGIKIKELVSEWQVKGTSKRNSYAKFSSEAAWPCGC